jgi:hypothetical protein
MYPLTPADHGSRTSPWKQFVSGMTIMAGEQRLATQPLFQVMNRAKHVLPGFA